MINEQYYIKEDLSDLLLKTKTIIINKNDDSYTFTCESDNNSVIYILSNISLEDVYSIFSNDIIDYVYSLTDYSDVILIDTDWIDNTHRHKYHHQNKCYIDRNGYVLYSVNKQNEYVYFYDNEISVYSVLSEEQSYAVMKKMYNEHYDEPFLFHIHYNDTVLNISVFKYDDIIDIIASIYASKFINTSITGNLYLYNKEIKKVNESYLSEYSLLCIINKLLLNNTSDSYYDRLYKKLLFEHNTDTTFGIVYKEIVRLVKKYSDDMTFLTNLMNSPTHSETIITDCFFHFEYSDSHNKKVIVSKKKCKNIPKGEHPIIILFQYFMNSDAEGESVRDVDSFIEKYGYDTYKQDPLYLVFNLAHIIGLNNTEEVVSHELTHSLEQFGIDDRNCISKPNKQFYKLKSNDNCKISGTFSCMNNDFPLLYDIYNNVKMYLYIMNPYEQNSFIEEMSTHIRYKLPEEQFKLICDNCDYGFDSIKDVLVKLTYNQNRLFLMNSLLEFLNKDNYQYDDIQSILTLCMIGYYINKHHYRTINKQCIRKDYIEKISDEYIDIYDNELQKLLRSLRYTVFNIVKTNIDKYSDDVEKEVEICILMMMNKYKIKRLNLE